MKLKEVKIEDVNELLFLQKIAFQELLDTYQDYQTNPANETIHHIETRMKQPNSTYYFITVENIHIGGIRVVKRDNQILLISPIFIIPEYQGKKYAQQAMQIIEHTYPKTTKIQLQTIKEEKKICAFYKKIGYTQYGEEQILYPNMTLVSLEKIVEKRM